MLSNPNLKESEWEDWCKYDAAIPSKKGAPTKLLRVLCDVGNPDEYKDLSKDGCGAYRKGDSHKGQFIWKTKKGKYMVAPVYAHASKAKVFAALKSNPDCAEVCGFFRQNCLVEIPNDVVDKSGKMLLKAGVYRSNSARSNGQVAITNSDGISPNPISIQYLMPAGMKRIKLDTV